jgi:CRP-like cAMP-binding protein
VRYLPDGRRQVIGLLLPGDLVGNCRQCRPVSVSTVVSLTAVEFCAAPLAALHPSLGEAYAVSHALDEAYLIAQVMRLGRLNAEERLADLLLELLERLNTCDTAGSDNFRLPLSQEVLSDTLGLSSVHFNRTLQRLRHRGDITFKTGLMTIADPALLGDRIGHVRARVTADSSTPSESAEDPCL